MNSQDAFRLDHKTILICGATGGLGRPLAQAAAKLGASVVLLARDAGRLEALSASLEGTGHRVIAADVRDLSAQARILAECPPLHGMIYAAGTLGKPVPFPLLKAEQLLDELDANTIAPLMFTQALLKRRLFGRGASLVFLTSTNATANTMATSAYSASKAALAAGLRCVAAEVSKKGIRVNTVAHGYVQTASLEALGVSPDYLALHPLGLPSPEAVTGGPLFLLCDASRWMTRSKLRVDGGLTLRLHQTI